MTITKSGSLALIACAMLAFAAGCSENTGDAISEDINDGARKVENAVEDAAD